MSIILERVGAPHGSSVLALVRHGDHAFFALVAGDEKELQLLVGQDVLVEMSFEQVASWRELPDFQEADSYMKESTQAPGAVMLQGRVHNVIPIDAESATVDLYLQTGPEFIAIDSKEIGGYIPAVGSALEVHVHGLCFCPTNT